MFVRRFAGMTLESRNRFTQYDPVRHFVEFEIPEGQITGRASYLVEPTGDADCRSRSEMYFHVSGILALLTPVLSRLLARESRRDELGPKELLELPRWSALLRVRPVMWVRGTDARHARRRRPHMRYLELPLPCLESP